MEPIAARRPRMPGYGILPADEGTGLLPWSWAAHRLTGSRNYWVSSVWPDGRPHVMPVWGVWDGDAFWFSSGLRSRKCRNLDLEPRCTVATQDPEEPVVLDGLGQRRTTPAELEAFITAVNAKYDTDYGVDFLDPAVNATFRVAPRSVFGLTETDFVGSPTIWEFPG